MSPGLVRYPESRSKLLLSIVAFAGLTLLAGCDYFVREQGTKPGALSTIVAGNERYKQTYGRFAPTLKSLGGDLPCKASEKTACLIDPILASGHKSGYSFIYAVASDGKGYAVAAEPDDKHDVFYYTDQTGVIRSENEHSATASSRVVK